jgi:hypothetical protein
MDDSMVKRFEKAEGQVPKQECCLCYEMIPINRMYGYLRICMWYGRSTISCLTFATVKMKVQKNLYTRNLRDQRMRYALPRKAVLLMLLLLLAKIPWIQYIILSILQVNGFMQSKIANQKRKK